MYNVYITFNIIYNVSLMCVIFLRNSNTHVLKLLSPYVCNWNIIPSVKIIITITCIDCDNFSNLKYPSAHSVRCLLSSD